MKQNYGQFETITIEGVEYISPSACTFGDYGGAGSVGLSNIRSILASAEKEGLDVFDTFFSDIERASATEKPGSYAMDSELELRAAIKARRKPIVLHVSGGYSSETVYIKRHSLLAHETLEALADYPSLDDDAVSAIESEWESEAFDSWLLSDLDRAAWAPNDEPENDDIAAAYSAMSRDDKFSVYHFAMETENEYPTPEYNGVHVDVKRIAATYRATIERIIKESV